MSHLANTVVLALALLMSQTAIAVHDVHCLDEEHNQTCEVFFTQDHSASTNTDIEPVGRFTRAENLECFRASISPHLIALSYLSRAPPKHI